MNLQFEQIREFPREAIVAVRIENAADPLRLDPASWSKHLGSPQTTFYHQHTDISADERTEVYSFFNDTHLGFAMISYDYDKEHFDPGKPGFTIWADEKDGMDIFLDPGLSGAGVVRLSMNPAGGRVQMAFAPGTPYYPYRWQSRGIVKDEYWAAICWVAFEDIGMATENGDVWGVNITTRRANLHLTPNFDFFKFPEQLCLLRFGKPSPVKDVGVDQSQPGALAARFLLDRPEAFETLRATLRPCWGQTLETVLKPAQDMTCAFKHGFADRVMCELRVYGRAERRERLLGLYRLYTPPVLELKPDRRGGRYGPADVVAKVTVRRVSDDPIHIPILALWFLAEPTERLVRSIETHGKENVEIALSDLPCGAYALRGKDTRGVLRAECFFNKVPVQPPAVREHDEYLLSELTDFPDNLTINYYDWRHFQQYYRHMKSFGVKRSFWIDYGSRGDTWFYTEPAGRTRGTSESCNGYSTTARNGTRTFGCVGDMLNAALVAARQNGLEFFATMKPFETGIGACWLSPKIRAFVSPDSPEAMAHGVVSDMVDGMELLSSRDLTTDYPGMFFKRRNWKPPYVGPLSEIRLYHTDDKSPAPTPENFTFWVSDDNWTYRKLEGAVRTENTVVERFGRSCRCFAFKELGIRERYVILTCDRNEGTFCNRMSEIAEAFDAAGKPIEISVGYEQKQGKEILVNNKPARQGRVSFGILGLGVIAGQRVEDTFLPIDNPDFNIAIAIARGKDRQKVVPDPSEPDGRRFLMNRVRRLIRAGADGIQFRHQHHLAFAEPDFYGYSPAVIEEYRRRHGVDITQVMPERDKFEEIHGEFYTEFFRRARELTDAAGVQVIINVPESQGFMCELPVKLQWARWIRLGLCDAITLKNVYPGTMKGEALRVLTRRHNMALYFNPYHCHKHAGPPGKIERYRRLLDRSIEAGHDGYNRYEGHGVLFRAKQGSDEPDIVVNLTEEERSLFLSLNETKVNDPVII